MCMNYAIHTPRIFSLCSLFLDNSSMVVGFFSDVSPMFLRTPFGLPSDSLRTPSE